MADIIEIKNYLKKLQKIVNNADFAIFGSSITKKSKIDDTLCCLLALLPESYKTIMKRRTAIDRYPSVSGLNRLSKTIKKPFFLSNDFYIFKTNEVLTLIQSITKNIDRDLARLIEEDMGN